MSFHRHMIRTNIHRRSSAEAQRHPCRLHRQRLKPRSCFRPRQASTRRPASNNRCRPYPSSTPLQGCIHPFHQLRPCLERRLLHPRHPRRPYQEHRPCRLRHLHRPFHLHHPFQEHRQRHRLHPFPELHPHRPRHPYHLLRPCHGTMSPNRSSRT